MDAQEKWKRLNRPTCAADYGLSMSRDEMEQIPELAPFLNDVDEIRARREWLRKAERELGKNMAHYFVTGLSVLDSLKK